MYGVSIQHKNLVSPIAGLFGVSVQKKTNVLLTIIDSDNSNLGGVTVTYNTVNFTTSTLSSLYELVIPLSTLTTVTISKLGYITQSFNITIAANDFMVIEKTMILSIIPYSILIRR